jgi:hypothetical protein
MAAAEARLMEGWGKVGEGEESGVDFFDELAVGFGFVADADPIRIFAEGFPVGSGGVTAGMGEDVDKSFAFEGLVGGKPVGDVFDAVFFEKLHGVVAETAEEVVELALEDVVDTEFVDGG